MGWDLKSLEQTCLNNNRTDMLLKACLLSVLRLKYPILSGPIKSLLCTVCNVLQDVQTALAIIAMYEWFRGVYLWHVYIAAVLAVLVILTEQ